MKTSDKAKLELEQALFEFASSAAERGADGMNAEEAVKISGLTDQYDRAMVLEEAERRMHFSANAPEPAADPAVAFDAVMDDFGHWAAHQGVTKEGVFQPNYMLYVVRDIPEAANVVRAFNPKTGGMDAPYKRALETDSAPGQNTIPGKQFLAPRVAMYTGNPMRDIPGVSVFSTPDGNTRTVSVMTRPTTGVPFAPTTESGNATELEPVISNTDFDAYAYRRFANMTRELTADNAIGLQGLLPQFYTGAMESSFGMDLVTGTGSSQPTGIVTTAPDSGTYASLIAASDKGGDADITARSIGRFLNLMPIQYAMDSVIIMHQNTWNAVEFAYNLQSQSSGSGVRTTVQANNLLTITRLTDAAPRSINGTPVYINNWMHDWRGDDMSGNDNQKIMVRFVPSYMYIRDVQGIEFQFDPYSRAQQYQGRINITMRGDGGYVDTGNGNLTTMFQST